MQICLMPDNYIPREVKRLKTMLFTTSSLQKIFKIPFFEENQNQNFHQIINFHEPFKSYQFNNHPHE